MILVKLLHPENAKLPILVTLDGITTLVKPLHPENALFPILVILVGIVILVKPLHPENALSPILVTLSGIVILVKAVQPLKAFSPITVTQEGMTTKVIFPGHLSKVLLSSLKVIPCPLAVCNSFSSDEANACGFQTGDLVYKSPRLWDFVIAA